MIGRSDENGPNGSGIEDDGACYTLNCTDQHAVLAFAQNMRGEVRIQADGTLSGALSANQGSQQTTYVCETANTKSNGLMAGESDVMNTLDTRETSAVAPIAASPAMVVRRLTPTECERLQGFPDGWTKIPYKGKPADECPDGPRYKAIGNSMAVPVMRWIGERIDMFERGEM